MESFSKELRIGLDDYIQNKGHTRSIKNSELYTIIPAKDGIVWAGVEFNCHKTHEAAHELVTLYREITSHEFRLYKDENESLIE